MNQGLPGQEPQQQNTPNTTPQGAKKYYPPSLAIYSNVSKKTGKNYYKGSISAEKLQELVRVFPNGAVFFLNVEKDAGAKRGSFTIPNWTVNFKEAQQHNPTQGQPQGRSYDSA